MTMTEETTYTCDLTGEVTNKKERVVDTNLVIPTSDGHKEVFSGHCIRDIVPDNYLEHFTDYQSLSRINVLASGEVERSGVGNPLVSGLLGVEIVDSVHGQKAVLVLSAYRVANHNKRFYGHVWDFVESFMVEGGDEEEEDVLPEFDDLID